MGVKNLIKFIKRYAPKAITYKRIDEYRNTRIGFDANLLIYKIVYGIRVRGYDLMNDDKVVTHIHALLMKFIGFMKYNITPVFVFDTKMPKIKYNTMKKREEAKNKMIKKYQTSKSKEGKRKHYYMSSDITDQDIEECKQLILMFGYNLIMSKEEADSQLVNLYNNGIIQYIASEDMDILLFGGNKLLKCFTVNPKKYIQEIDLDLLLKEAGITMDQFIRIGLLHGTDYCDNRNISSIQAYKKVTQNEDNMKEECKKAYDYFIEVPSHNIKLQSLQFDRPIDKKSLKEFLMEKGYKQKYIKKLFSDIKKYIC
jgi:flap endonuclease-1